MARSDGQPKKRVNVTISYEFYDLLKKEADMIGSSVPAVLVSNAYEHINQRQLVLAMPAMLSQMNEISDKVDGKKQ